MLVKVFAVYDSKLKAYMAPQYFQTGGVAERAFKKAVNTPDTGFFDNPEDYTMFELGTFDDEKGAFELYTAPIVVIKAIQLKETAQNTPS